MAWRVLTIIALLASGLSAASYRSAAVLSGTDGTCRFYETGDSTWMSSRFTYLMAWAACPEHIVWWRTNNPECRIVFYTSGTDLSPNVGTIADRYVSTGKSTYIRNRMVELGDIAEQAYLHFYDDTKIYNGADTITIAGTNSLTISAKDSVSRVPNGYTKYMFDSRNTYTAPTRLAPNLSNANVRLAYKEYITKAFTSARITYWPDMTDYWDGIFFDNYCKTCLQGGSLASGGLVVETGNDVDSLLTYASAAYGLWGWELMKTFGKEVRDTLSTSATWSADNKKKILAYNAGLTWDTTFIHPDSCGADAVVWEYGFNPVNSPNNSIWRLENIYTHDSAASANGLTYCWVSYARIDYATKRNSIYNDLCFFYLARADSTWMYVYPSPGYAYGAFYNPGFDTLVWVPAMSYDIGNPVDKYELDTTGTSPDHGTFKIWKREYDYAMIYVRPRDDLNYSNWGTNSTAITTDLGGEYRKLQPDGTLGEIITEISLLGAEGAILIPVSSGTCGEAPSIPVLSSPADSATVASLTPTLCDTNATQPDSCTTDIFYEFQVSPSSDFANIVAQGSHVDETGTTTCWTVSTALNAGQLYYWRCRAKNGYTASNWSDWSSSHRFVTPSSGLTAPTLLTPTDTDTSQDLNVTLTVDEPESYEGVTHFRFEVATDSFFNWIVACDTVVKGATTTSWAVTPDLIPYTVYCWRAFAYNGVIWSSASEVWSFTTEWGLTLVATPSSLTISDTVGAVSSEHIVTLTASSDSALTIGVTNDSTWMDADCIDQCIKKPYRILASITYGGRPAGTYLDTIRVTCLEVANSPLKIPVTMTLTSGGTRLMLRK